jgi:two-component system response regulator NreC
MGRNIQVAVIDTAGLMRDGVCALLRGTQELEVVGAIDSDPVQIGAATIPAPDVAVMDFPMASRMGMEAVAAVRKRWPGVHILMLTLRNENRLVDAALHAGIEGYVLKSDTHAELVSAIRSVSAGNRYLAPSVCGRVGVEATEDSAEVIRPNGPTLSEREREVMRLIAEGYRTREMAQQLSLSHKTIEKHRSNLMRKLGLRSATAVAAYAITHGYVVLAT